jgi:enolase-phosphatase E1
MRFTGRGILLDIEGTTSSVRFVYDVMFPFVRRELAGYLAEHADDEALAFVADQIARERGEESFDSWTRSAAATNSAAQRNLLEQEVLRLMDGDVKSTGLKQLQGMIWRRGFESGELRAHVYDDVPAALAAWNKRGLDVRIYSSGSVAAQKLFFGHTEVGDLLGHFRGHYDNWTLRALLACRQPCCCGPATRRWRTATDMRNCVRSPRLKAAEPLFAAISAARGCV